MGRLPFPAPLGRLPFPAPGRPDPGIGLNPNCNSDGLNSPPSSPDNCLGFLSSEPDPNPDPPKGLNPELSNFPGLNLLLSSSLGAEGFLSGSTKGLDGTG